MPKDKFEEIEDQDLQTPGVREPDMKDEDDDDVAVDDGMDLEEPETVGAPHSDEDPETGKGLRDKEQIEGERIPQDSDPSE
jgi:hypothetical protein